MTDEATPVEQVGLAGQAGPAEVERRAVDEAAEGYVEALVAQGVECLFLNPGTDTFPVQEALVKLETLGRTVPRTVHADRALSF